MRMTGNPRWNAFAAALCCAAMGGCSTPGGGSSRGEDPVRVIELQHADADALADELTQEYGPRAQFISDPVTNALLIFAPEPMLDEMEEIALDVDVYDGPANSILRCSATDASRPRATYPQGPAPEPGEQFVLDFEDIDLSELAEVFANAYRVPVIADERLQGRVSFTERQPVTPERAYAKFIEVFESAGFAVVQGSSGELKILPSACLELSRLAGGKGTSESELRLARALEARGPSAVLCLGSGDGKGAPDPKTIGLTEAVTSQTYLLEFPDPFAQDPEDGDPQDDASEDDSEEDLGPDEELDDSESAQDEEAQADGLEGDDPAAPEEDGASEPGAAEAEDGEEDAAEELAAVGADDDPTDEAEPAEEDELEDDEAAPRQYQAELADVIEVMKQLLDKEIRYDRNVRGLVSLIAEEPVSAERAYQLLVSVLELRGFTLALEPRGELSVVLNRCIRVGRGTDPDEEDSEEEDPEGFEDFLAPDEPA